MSEIFFRRTKRAVFKLNSICRNFSIIYSAALGTMELLKDLIPVICDLINSVRAEHPDSEIESADIAHKLIRLEELDDRFEDLALVAEMKRVIADVVPEGKNGVALRPRKGLEPLRNRLLGTVAEAVGGLSNEDVLQAILFKKARPGESHPVGVRALVEGLAS